MPGVQMLLHGREGIAHQAKGHQFIRRALMFNQHVDIARPVAGLQRVENIGIAGAQVFFNKAAGGELKCLKMTLREQFAGKVRL